MAGKRITKRIIDGLEARPNESTVRDAQMPGFGVRVRPPTDAMAFVVVYSGSVRIRMGHSHDSICGRYTHRVLDIFVREVKSGIMV
jgi:hypothetical protein